MKYNFDKLTVRNNTGSLKWDIEEHELPMWVADMDFETAVEIQEAIRKRAVHGIYGYSIVTEDWYQAYISWWKRRHAFSMDREWLIFCTGVVPAISSIIRKLTTIGENILVQPPVYNVFFNSILNNGRNIVENRLIYDEAGYHIEFDDLEEKLSNPQTTMMILCNPHNPIGKIWDKNTLAQIGELCYKHHVIVLSDEIHCDLTDPMAEYIPFASISDICRENSITCLAPTKAFNLAGIQTAAVMVSDKTLRHKVWRGFHTDEIAEPNAFAIPAAVAAFTKGEEWLDELREYLFQNKKFTREYLERNLPQLKMVSSEATYLLWLDCGKIIEFITDPAEFVRQSSGLFLSTGKIYGENGSNFLRMNIACPRARLEDGLERLRKCLEVY